MDIQKNVIFYIIAILLLIIDQITKWIVSTNMYLGQALPEEGFLRLAEALGCFIQLVGRLYQNSIIKILIRMSIR